MLLHLGLKMLYKSPVDAWRDLTCRYSDCKKKVETRRKRWRALRELATFIENPWAWTVARTCRSCVINLFLKVIHRCSLAYQKSSKAKWQTGGVKYYSTDSKALMGSTTFRVIEDWSLAHNLRNMQTRQRWPPDTGRWFCLIYGKFFHQAELSTEV